MFNFHYFTKKGKARHVYIPVMVAALWRCQPRHVWWDWASPDKTMGTKYSTDVGRHQHVLVYIGGQHCDRRKFGIDLRRQVDVHAPNAALDSSADC